MAIRSSSIATLLVALTVGVLLSSTMMAQNSATGPSPKIQGLLQERRDTLKQRVAVLEAQFQSGLAGANLDTFVSARDDLLKAELTLATTRQQRIEILKLRLQNFQEFEKYANERRNAGRESTEADVLVLKAARIQAQIDLLREEES